VVYDFSPLRVLLVPGDKKIVHMCTYDTDEFTIVNKGPDTGVCCTLFSTETFEYSVYFCIPLKWCGGQPVYRFFNSRMTFSPCGRTSASASSGGAKQYLHFVRGRPCKKAAVTSPLYSFHPFWTTCCSRSCLLRRFSVGLLVCSCPKYGSWKPRTTSLALPRLPSGLSGSFF
jgi:hypothetical protein